LFPSFQDSGIWKLLLAAGLLLSGLLAYFFLDRSRRASKQRRIVPLSLKPDLAVEIELWTKTLESLPQNSEEDRVLKEKLEHHIATLKERRQRRSNTPPHLVRRRSAIKRSKKEELAEEIALWKETAGRMGNDTEEERAVRAKIEEHIAQLQLRHQELD